jgi:hypothetical protein
MKKVITVQELIDQLNQIENKNLPIDCTIGITGVSVIDTNSVLDLEDITFRTNKFSDKAVAATIVLNGIPKVIHEQSDEFTPIEVGKNFSQKSFDKLSRDVKDKKIVLSVLNGIKRNALLAMYDQEKLDAIDGEE